VRIDPGEQIAFLDGLTFLEVDADQQAWIWLRTVTLFSAVTVPRPQSTIGTSRCWTVVAVTGTG
jgi:hypothetical protein